MQETADPIVDSISKGEFETIDFPEKQKALLRFVKLITLESHKNSPEEIQKLRESGWNDAQIAETVLVTGMFAMFNRVADAFGLEDPDYFERKKQGEQVIPATQYKIDPSAETNDG